MKPATAFDPNQETDPEVRAMLGLAPLPEPAAPSRTGRSTAKANLPRGANADPALLAEKVRLTAAQGEKLELQNAASRGELVSSAAVEREWTGIIHDIRRALLAVPARLTDVDRRIIERVEREIRDALGGLANG